MDSSSSSMPTASPSTLAAAYALLDVPVAWADPLGRLQGSNPAFSQLTGHSAAGLPAQTLATLLQIEAGPEQPSTLSLLSLNADLTDLAFLGRDATGRDLAGTLSRRCHAGGQVIRLQLAADAAGLQQRLAQQAQALALAERLKLAAVATGVGIWTSAAGPDLAPHWDDQMRALHGLEAGAPAPTLDEYVDHLVHPDDRASMAEAMGLLRRREQGQVDLDLRIIRPDGQMRRLATRASINRDQGGDHLYGVMLDVTERHAAQDDLRRAHERSALATRGAGIGTWESDANASEGWWDEQMFKLRGREPSPGPVALATMIAWLHPDDRSPHEDKLAAAVQSDTPTNQEFRVLLPDGRVRWLASRSVPVHDALGRTVRRIGINWDVTDVREAAATREASLLAQRESQAKSRLLARISHELRTPLNAVLGFSQLLLADGPDPANWRRRVEQVRASGEHLLTLIDDVLDLSSLESGELRQSLQPVALHALIDACLPLVELQAQSQGVTLHRDATDDWAWADPMRLRQALLNLLSNAIKYNRPQGQVRISVAQPADGDAETLLLRVEDTGRGLSEEQISHLFEPFNRLGIEREGISGTGIGLAIVRSSVQQMGGQVRVRSQPGHGSCFELQLRRARANTAGPMQGRRTGLIGPAPSPSNQARVLYIEDNEVNLLIVDELLKDRRDLLFIPASHGQQGLTLARSQQPALILLDLHLPDMDGQEVLRHLRADPSTAAIRCIALSANAMPDDIRQARALGFDDYWTKPLDVREFKAALVGLFGPAPA